MNDDLRAVKESVSDLIEREVERRLREMIPIDTQKVIDDLHAEVERLKALNQEKFKDAVRIELADFRDPHEAEIRIRSVLVEPMILMLREWFDAAGGVNYVALTAFADGEEYEFVMQRKSGETPSEQNIRLRTEVERLKATQRKLARLARDMALTLETVINTVKNKSLPSADEQVDLAFRLGQTMEMINSDPLVAAAIAEVKGAKKGK